MVVYRNNQTMVVDTQYPMENSSNFVWSSEFAFASQAAMEATEKAEFNLSMEEAGDPWTILDIPWEKHGKNMENHGKIWIMVDLYEKSPLIAG